MDKRAKGRNVFLNLILAIIFNGISEEERQIVSENYKILTYKDLYQFLVKNNEEIKKYPFGAKFYEDILEITKRMSESKRERTKRLFLAQIAKSF